MEDPKLEEDAEFDESGHAKSAGLASRPAPVLQLTCSCPATELEKT
jgi:hypothetical protein